MITTQPRLLFRATGFLLTTLLLIAALQVTGCASVYHRAKADLPADPDDRLTLRMQEARAAALDAADKSEALADAIEAPRPLDSSKPPAEEIAAARAQASLIELDRRLLAAADTLGTLPATGAESASITTRDTATLTHQRLTHARDLLDTTLTAAGATGLRNAETPAALRAAAVRLREAADPGRSIDR